jgi:hypothetical protein
MKVWPGEEEAWDILSELDAKDVAANAGAIFDSHDSTYALTCLGQEIRISLRDRTIYSESRRGTLLITSLGDYSRLSILRYLIHAKDLPLSGRLVRPADLPGGDIFTKGTHILPLDKLAAYFSQRRQEFLQAGQSLGGAQGDYGDMSLNIFPFPRVPVALILWSGDEEFPSTASLLFDSSCVSHLPPDVIWSTSMMTVEMMLNYSFVSGSRSL